jgi:hypothetical protein
MEFGSFLANYTLLTGSCEVVVSRKSLEFLLHFSLKFRSRNLKKAILIIFPYISRKDLLCSPLFYYQTILYAQFELFHVCKDLLVSLEIWQQNYFLTFFSRKWIIIVVHMVWIVHILRSAILPDIGFLRYPFCIIADFHVRV